GIYYDSLLTQNGCDSVFELDLVVFDLPNVDIISTDSFVCVYNTPLNLAAIPAGGVWNGQGLSGNNFDPAAAGIGSWIITYHFADTNGCENADTITILVDACTGLENEVFSGITLYPNPTSGQLSITFPAEDDYTLSFIDALGQIILTTKISAQKTVQIDLKSFAPGVYMLKIENAEGFVLKRVVLER
ncbi:MAG TPA: T9SS type A sorting domain-containing protein, partial [Bacteroidales bacterium]|nr:T9SS type A sorting domain-containing protein [Bacteroidales bacterium]